MKKVLSKFERIDYKSITPYKTSTVVGSVKKSPGKINDKMFKRIILKALREFQMKGSQIILSESLTKAFDESLSSFYKQSQKHSKNYKIKIAVFIIKQVQKVIKLSNELSTSVCFEYF